VQVPRFVIPRYVACGLHQDSAQEVHATIWPAARQL
jgi:hypothetical protein